MRQYPYKADEKTSYRLEKIFSNHICTKGLRTRIYKELSKFNSKKTNNRGFPGCAVVKNPPANAGDTGSSPGRGRSHIPRSN